jgi:hypothetical protein
VYFQVANGTGRAAPRDSAGAHPETQENKSGRAKIWLTYI